MILWLIGFCLFPEGTFDFRLRERDWVWRMDRWEPWSIRFEASITD